MFEYPSSTSQAEADEAARIAAEDVASTRWLLDISKLWLAMYYIYDI